MPNFVNLLTAKQVISTYSFAGATKDNLPSKHTVTVLPVLDGFDVHITKTNHKSTYGPLLYRCEHIKRGGPRCADCDQLLEDTFHTGVFFHASPCTRA